MNRLKVLLVVLLCINSQPSTAEPGRWALCKTFNLLPPLIDTGTTPTGGEIFADADSIESAGDNITKLYGDVLIARELDQLQADSAIYFQTDNRFDLNGNIRYRSKSFESTAQSMTLYNNSDRSEMYQAYFFMPQEHGNGYAKSITRDGDITQLYNASYSTCDPKQQDWQFRAKQITLNHDTGRGLAKNMSLRFKKVPFFYLPVLSFPIDDRRKSGFLMQGSGIGNSDEHGFELIAPYYWNIAPQADATLTSHFMRRRGLKLDTEWRYLSERSTNQLDTEFLDDDLFGDSRSLVRFNHQGSLSAHWQTRLNGTSVSDKDYLEDFGGNLSTSSITHLPRRAQLIGNWQHWRFNSQLLTYQTVDETIPDSSRPYRLLPSLTLNGLYPEIIAGLDFQLGTTLTQFDQNDRVTGNRFDLLPRISRPFGGISWFATPSLSLRYTQYELDNLANPDDPTDISRTVPTLSLDTGLFFERRFGNQKYLQTLEPRLYYLRVPFRNQDDIPIFDTSLPAFNFAQLFTENRFVGTDRVGDADQVSFSLSSRILRNQTGEEFFKASIGQIYYRDDRQITLSGSQADTEDRSDIIGELKFAFAGHWSTSATVEWNPEREETDKEIFRLRYNRDNDHIVNLQYRFRDQDLEQTDLSFNWRVTRRWSMAGRWNRSLQDEVDLEKFLGIAYESCCFAIRIVAREYLVNDSEFNQGIQIQLSLKGLTGIGDNIGELLEQGILGYIDSY